MRPHAGKTAFWYGRGNGVKRVAHGAVRWEAARPPVPGVEEWWEAAGLPEPPANRVRTWWGAPGPDGNVVGVVGLEDYGDVALLRSLVVAPFARGLGHGAKLMWAALGEALGRFQAVYLLTVDAAAYFRPWGFQAIAREDLPAALAASDEVAGSCPVSATVMRLPLKPPLVRIRPARPEDASAVAAIYNEGIQDRMATFETELRTPDERRRWIVDRPSRYGVLVAETAEGVVGWVSLNPFSPRPAYRYVADISIYVRRQARSGGVGGRLLRAAMAWAAAHEFHKLVLTLFPENVAARRLYLRHGFRPVGVLHEQGLLDGVWRDTEMMERLLTDVDDA